MDNATRTGASLNQFNGFNAQQDQDFSDLMKILEEQEIGSFEDACLPAEAEYLIQEELNAAKNITTYMQTRQYVEKFRNFIRKKSTYNI